MKTVGQIVRQKREELGLTLEALASRVDATKGYLSQIENHKLANPPSQGLLENLQKALQIKDQALVRAAMWQNTPAPVRADIDALSTKAQAGEELAKLLSQKPRRRGDGTKSLDDPALLRELTRRINAGAEVEKSSTSIKQGMNAAMPGRVPLINKVAAGYPSDFTDLGYPARVADEYVWASPDIDDADAFAATVVGDSMLPEYREGDVVIFSPRAKVEDGNDCFVRLEPDHSATFKRIFFDGKKKSLIRLQPLNPKFPPQTVERELVAGLYRAVGRYQKI